MICSGYMSPKYAIDGVFSIKSGVFSSGVLVLEIVRGKRNRGFTHPEHELNLLGHVRTFIFLLGVFKLAFTQGFQFLRTVSIKKHMISNFRYGSSIKKADL